jgi:sulfite reductase (NADPH) hemoprotein beta-component
MNEQSRTQKPLSEVEHLKASSNYLRGTIQQGLADPVTGAVAEEDTHLLKFHGIYQQDDRDLRVERSRQKLEPAYSFMIRVRVPGGICTPAQWLHMDRLACSYANGSLRLTTRQAFQLHGVLKRNLKETIARINAGLLDTIAACGDVNRNVMCNPNPYQSAVHKQVYAWAKLISTHLLPKTRAYHEIWLDGQKAAGGEDSEPLYGKTYLPRKFKTAVAVPPSNDVDVYAHDLGFIAIVEKGKLIGFNISVGGGLGMTHSDPATYPRLADVIGFCQPEQVLAVAEQVIAVQRDYGERSNRKHARLKYTIEDRGIDWFKSKLQTRLGWPLQPQRPVHFDSTGDRLGWVKGINGKWHFTLFIQNGRIKDSEDYSLMTALREIAVIHTGDFRLTPNQNLIIGNITSRQKSRIQALLDSYRLDHSQLSGLRLNSMACVALPTCGLAMAESERYLPDLVTKLEKIMAEAGLQENPIVIRMTGCPNGCARPYLAEIGLVGKTLGRYNLYLGAGLAGERLNKLYRENASEADILEALTPIIHHYARERGKGEHFGDFVIRTGYVKAVRAGREFHS